MGSRGAFENVEMGKFKFIDNGQIYQTVGMIDGVQVIVQECGSVKAPEFSHTKNRVYAIVQNGALKHLSFYDDEHRQAVSIDLLHSHRGVQPHKHLYLNHNDNGIEISESEKELIKRIKRRFGLK